MKTSWQTKKLGEVSRVGAGNSAPQDKSFFLNGKFPFFRTSDVGQVHVGSISESVDYLNEKGSRGLRVFPKNTILMPKSGASTFLNHRVIMDVNGYVSSHLATINTNENVLETKFLFYFLQQIRSQDLIQDHKYPSLNLSIIENIKVPLAPISEQKRIVKMLDDVFEKLTKAKENAKKNLQNSKELFESCLNNVFVNPGKNWETKQLAEIAEIEYGYTDNAKTSGDFRFVRITDTDECGLLTTAGKMFVKDFKDSNKYTLIRGDLLMARTGASAGNVLLFDSNEKAVFASYLIRIRANKNISGKLYWYFSKSRLYWDQVKQLSAGSAQPQFNGGALKQVAVSFPKSLSEQGAIIKKLDALSVETKKLERIYAQKLADLEELKKSVLSKAFQGKL